MRGFFDPPKHLAPGSDIAALMVLQHQAHMHNYIARLNFETQLTKSNLPAYSRSEK